MPPYRGFVHPLDMVLVSHVGRDEAAAGLFRGSLARRLVDVDGDDDRSLGGEPPRTGKPDAAAGARDDGDPILQTLHSRVHPSVAMKTFLVSVKASSASGPSSRPRPDCLNPPNGVE